ncbi:M60 family metallopeptidase [Pedobacter gandavensis]|uniref:M60 family metallopeptidase n=1 Tax=Pedobacter gandavensis TaxID=2679963 RepID=UPI00292E8A14|nr:M60 family metallopeptidase [Pedobacter gandavensis]
MKNIYFNMLCGVLLLSMVSCKKYGYHFEDGYNKPGSAEGNEVPLDTAMSRVDRSLYSRARIFPGMVDANEPRVKDTKFTLDLNFSASNKFLLRISVAPEPQFSTGFYAPAGELIKIMVPAGVNGLSVQVGGHTDNLTGQANLKRDPLIFSVQQLYPGANYVRNGYGGTIYIRAAFAIQQPVEFTITGAVKSPDFVLGKSNDAAWIAEVKASTVPWLELRSNRVIFLIPRDFLIRNFNSAKPLTQPTALMTAWNNVFELDFNGWMGLSDNASDIRDQSPQGAWREVLDIQPSVGYGHNGFPTVATMDNEWFNSVVSLDQLLHGANWGTYHEFGHNCQQGSIWSWSTLGETTNNLFNYKVAHRNGADFAIQHGSDWVQPALNFASTEIGIGVKKDFDGPGIDDPFKRMVPFLQIFEQYGYDAMPYLYTAARHAARYSNTDQDKHDFVYERFSEYAKVDLRPFFEYWGISVSSQSYLSIGAKYPLLKTRKWTYNPMTKTGGKEIFNPVKIISSSQELVGEGSVNGRVSTLLDGNPATFWHSQWQGTPLGTMPYTIIWDQGLNKFELPLAKGLSLTARASARQIPKDIEIYSSDTNEASDWEKLGNFQLANTAGKKNDFIFDTPLKARFYKVIIKNNWVGNADAALAELSVIK